MNWIDLVVLAVILGFGLIGLASGFVNTVFKIASFFLSIFLAVKFYPAVAEMLKKTSLFSTIKGSILKSLFHQNQSLIQGVNGKVEQAAASSVIDNLPIPGFLKGILLGRVSDASSVMNMEKIADLISNELSIIIISIISLVLLYILIRVGLAFVRVILKGICKLPVFKQIDKLGGFTLGAIEGLLTVYILLAVLMLFNSSPQFESIFKAMNGSILATYFYEHNFIIDWMF